MLVRFARAKMFLDQFDESLPDYQAVAVNTFVRIPTRNIVFRVLSVLKPRLPTGVIFDSRAVGMPAGIGRNMGNEQPVQRSNCGLPNDGGTLYICPRSCGA